MIFSNHLTRTICVALFIGVGSNLHAKDANLELFFAADGNDANPGTRESPKKNLNSVSKGLNEARGLGVINGPVTFWMKGGVYHFDSALNLGSDFSGTEKAPVIIRGVTGEEVRLTTGSVLDNGKFLPAAGSPLSDRLPKKSLTHVKVIEITDKGSQYQLSAHNGLLGWNGHLLEKCRWPNRGYAHMSRVINMGPWTRMGQIPPKYSRENPTGGSFRPAEAIDLDALQVCHDHGDEIMVEGYFSNDWFYERILLGSAMEKKIQLRHHTRYGVGNDKGIGVPRRFRLINAVSELDEPGEWYFDPKTKLLAVWPVKPISATDVFTIPGHGAAVEVNEAKHLIIQNLIIEGTGDVGVRIKGGSHVTVGGCRINNGTQIGLSVNGGTHHHITGCTFSGLDRALVVRGGNRRKLVSCHHEVTNCEFSDLRKRGYGAVALRGVGIRFANNLMHNTNGSLEYRGNDILIEFNEFYNMGWEMGDWNTVYTGADWAGAGNVLRYNFVHHLMELPGAHPVGAFRNDDGGQGTQYHGNVFYKTGRYGVAFSGGNNQLTSNVALETDSLWYTEPGAKNAAEIADRWAIIEKYNQGELKRGDKGDYVWKVEQIYGKEGWKTGLWPERYPNLKQVMEDRNGWAPTYCTVRDNYADSGGVYVHGGALKDLPSSLDFQKLRKISANRVFADARAMTFSAGKSFKTAGGSESLPLHKMGLFIDTYRTAAPDPKVYRAAIKKRYRKSKSSGGKYNLREINERYPLPSYLRKK